MTRGAGAGGWPPRRPGTWWCAAGRDGCSASASPLGCERRGPEESEPETARYRSVWSEDTERPGARRQHVSTAPLPMRGVFVLIVPRSPRLLRVYSSQVTKPPPHALFASVVPSQSMPSRPESSSRSPHPQTPRFVTQWEEGGNRGRRDCRLSLWTREPHPQWVGSAQKGLSLRGKSEAPGSGADPGVSSLLVQGCSCCGGG